MGGGVGGGPGRRSENVLRDPRRRRYHSHERTDHAVGNGFGSRPARRGLAAVRCARRRAGIRLGDDRRRGGNPHRHLRCSAKQRRKGYGKYDSRGRLAGKRSISERPAGARNRSRVGHLEGDTVIGNISDKHCVLTLVDRMTGYVMIGKLESRTVEATNRRAVALIKDYSPPCPYRHGRQRHRVSRLQNDRSGHRLTLLLRHPVSLMGTRNQREHQWAHPTVFTEASKHDSHHSAPLQPHLPQAQTSPRITSRVPHPRGVL